MSLLTIIQDACLELKLPSPNFVIGNTDAQVKHLLALAKQTVKAARRDHDWPQLHKELTLTLVADQANYEFASDHDRQIFDTHWDRTNHWALIGPLSPGEWQHIKSGVVTTYPRKRYRIKGYADKQIYLDPTPSSSGDTLVFEYISKTCVRPREWETGITYNANTYTFNNGNIYSTTAGGVTGATAPTHTTSSASDGEVTWTYYSSPYETFLADTDVSLIDEEVIKLGTKYRWLEINRFEYEEAKMEYQTAIKSRLVAMTGAPILSLGGKRHIHRFISHWNLPDTGYGQ